MTSDTTFDRLREANPFRPATVEGADELFARITAEPGDARLADRKPRRWRRRRTIGLAVAFVAIALGSSAFATVHYMFGKGIVGASRAAPSTGGHRRSSSSRPATTGRTSTSPRTPS